MRVIVETVIVGCYSGGMWPSPKVIQTVGSGSWPTSHPGWAGRRVKRCVLSGWGAAASSMQLFMYLSFPKRRDRREGLAGVSPLGWFHRSGFALTTMACLKTHPH